MFIEIPYLQNKYYERNKYRPTYEYNFMTSQINTTVAFICDNSDSYSDLISVLDFNFNPILTYKTNAHIHACNISNDGNYIVWQTASSPYDDGNCIFLLDVTYKKLLWKVHSYLHCKFSKGIFVFPQRNIIECLFNDIIIQYDMSGNVIAPDKLNQDMLKSSCVSPYYLNNNATKLIDTLKCKFDKKIEQEILDNLTVAEQNPQMSKYQLSLTYKSLADCYYEKKMYNKALECYEKGLLYNNKLSVKRIISKLKKELYQ